LIVVVLEKNNIVLYLWRKRLPSIPHTGASNHEVESLPILPSSENSNENFPAPLHIGDVLIQVNILTLPFILGPGMQILAFTPTIQSCVYHDLDMKL